MTDFMRTLQDPAVRDLAWVIAAPSLLDAEYTQYAGQVVNDTWCAEQLQASLPWLRMLDAAPHTLHEHLAARPSRRLGLYFESLIAFWFAHGRDTTIIATNLQVRDENRTIGEYDLLWRDAAGQTYHWEVAVKFYLQAEPVPATRAFIGPGARDRLDLKLERVFRHQLGLCHTPAGRAALAGGIKPDSTQAYIKGYLFYPAGADMQTTPGVSTTHLRGWWLHYPYTQLPQVQADTRWVVMPRLHWLAPLRLAADADTMTQDEMRVALGQHFIQSHTALLLAEMARTEDGGWQECARGFVVHADWPHLPGEDQ